MEDRDQIKKELDEASSLKELDILHKKYLGRKGSISLALREIGSLSAEEKKEQAPKLQALKKEIEEYILTRAGELKSVEAEGDLNSEWLDVSAPGMKVERGHVHPLTHIQNEVSEIFTSLGFEIVEGPEVETEWYNFDALNIPADHPSRDMQDTFWLKPESQKMLLRTQTSPVQIRYMEKNQPPIRIISPGRVFRHEASDASHDMQFYQVEGLMVDKDISVAHFKAVINEFLQRLFGEDVKIRLRPSFFPFVEPGFEVDTYGPKGWMEMLGAGMVHPDVFKAVGYDPRNWQGFAFGVGLDRIAMMKYKIDDIRLLYSGDLRFLKQF